MEVSQKTVAQMNRGASASLAKAARDLGDKATWKPLDRGRSALDQVQEVASFYALGARVFEARAMPPFDRSQMEAFRAQNDTPEKALAALEALTEQFAAQVESFPTEKLDEKIVLPFGPGGMEKSFAELAMMIYWNTVYHEGQINYIQTLAAE